MNNRELRHTSEKSILGARIMARVAAGAGVFCVILSCIMIINHLQVKASDPLNSPALEELKESLENNPDDAELKNKIRSLDLLARRAVFTSQHMIKTGGYLLLIGAVILFASLRVREELKRRFPYVGRESASKERYDRLERKGLYIAGIILLFICFGISFIPGLEEEKKEETKQDQPVEAPSVAEEQPKDSWPAFRGPNGLGISHSETAPIEWSASEDKNIIWKLALKKHGDNSPVIWKDKIFLSSATEKDLSIICVNAKDGTVIWEKTKKDLPEASTALPEEVMKDVGHVASTMAVDKNGLFAIFSSGDVVCLDFDGKIKWAQKLGHIENPYGHSSSLITWQGKLFVQVDQEEEKGDIYALDTQTGKIIWQKKRPFLPCWATPIIISTGKRTELVVNGNPYLVSYDPATGDELWKLKYIDGNAEVAPSPVYENGSVFLANEYVYTCGIDIQTDPAAPKIIWQEEDNQPDVTSPLAVNGLLFVGTVYGVVCCYDGKTGEKYWEQEFDEGFYASPVYAAGNVYMPDKSGNTHIIAASKEYKLIKTCTLDETIFATPAITGGKLYLRGKKHLYCIGTK